MCKNLEATLLFLDFSEAFDSIHQGKMNQILRAYGLPKETVTAITMLYRNKKTMVCSPDRDRFLQHFCWNFEREYISTIFVYNLPRLYTSNVD